MLKKLVSLILLAASFGVQASNEEAEIKKTLEAKLNARVESVTKSGYLGLYEVFTEGNIVYTDDKASVVLVGPLIDTKTMKNVTEERMRKLTAIKFNELPFERAIKQVRGDGSKRVLATFEDPNCGYCKRLARDLQRLENVTIYTFLYPILSEDSVRKSKQIWCAADRAKAWNDWMIDGKVPAAKEDCDVSAIAKNQDYGRKLGISGTPTLFFADGERIPGAAPLLKIEQKLGK